MYFEVRTSHWWLAVAEVPGGCKQSGSFSSMYLGQLFRRAFGAEPRDSRAWSQRRLQALEFVSGNEHRDRLRERRYDSEASPTQILDLVEKYDWEPGSHPRSNLLDVDEVGRAVALSIEIRSAWYQHAARFRERPPST